LHVIIQHPVQEPVSGAEENKEAGTGKYMQEKSLGNVRQGNQCE